MPQAQQSAQHRRDELPIAGRSMDLDLRSFQRAAPAEGEAAPLATCEIVFSAGARVQRFDWYRERYYLEELVVEDGAIRLERLERGAPLLDTHWSYRLEHQLGVVEDPVIEGGRGTVRATFSRRESVAGVVQDVADSVIRNVSVGYIRHRVEMVPPDEEGGLWVYRVIDWEPMEVSLVPIPADLDSQVVRSAGGQLQTPDGRELRSFPCEFIEVRAAASSVSPAGGRSAATSTQGADMPQTQTQAAGGTNSPADSTQRNAATETHVQTDGGSVSDVQRAAQQAEQQRSADISDLCARHGVPTLAAGMIRSGNTLDQARAAVLEELARRDAAGGGHRNVNVETVSDETETRMAGITEALLHRVDSRAKMTDNGRQYRGMSLLEIGREHLERSGVSTRGLDRMTLATRIMQFRSGGMLTTSDFGSLMGNVANRRLRGAYDENPGSYSLWARRAPNAPDFKSMSIVQLSGAPDLLQVNEHGEFKYGQLTDGKETYGLLTYGRIVSLSRQALVNDDLRAFDRMVTAFGFAARRLENRTVYQQLTANAAMGDTVALFHANHANLGTGAGSALQESSLTTMRTAMRTQKGAQAEELNLVPAYLIVPAALEQTAYKLTSSQYVPAKQADVNEFRQGGRTALDPIIEPVLDANSATAWYAAASSTQVDTVEYCYLDGAEGPVIESEMGFEIDGLSLKCRHDFAAKAVDHRGLYKANGA